MDRDFTWNKSQAQIDYENALAAAAAAGARNGSQAAAAADPLQYYSKERIEQMPSYDKAMQQRMAQEADRVVRKHDMIAKVQRLKELEAQMQERDRKIQKMMDDPKMQLAVAMAMYGDNGLLQSMLVNNKEESSTQNQTNMDSLEDKMANDIFALGGASDDEFDKIVGALIPLYKDRFSELEGKGARSRLGGWDAWEQAILGSKGAFGAKKAKEEESRALARAKAEAQKLADKLAALKLKRGSL